MKELGVERRPLHTIADIHPGYPFRGKLPIDDEGDAFVVQFRHIVEGAVLNDSQGLLLDRTKLSGRKRPEYLRFGDVVFMAKGTRNAAAVIGRIPSNTVCTPNFYHLRLKHTDVVTPEFLAWQLNFADAQRYFSTCAQGSTAPSITKSQLAGASITIPSLERQALMVKLTTSATREQQLFQQLIENRQRMIDAVGQKILHPDHTTGN